MIHRGDESKRVTFFACFLFKQKPKGKRFTTAKAPLSMAINVEELISPSEDENEDEDDEWRPEKPEKGRRNSKKPKATGVGMKLGSSKLVMCVFNQ